MKKELTTQETMEMILAACDKIIASKDYLTEVDSCIGDGDHGIGMSGGMEKARTELLANAPFANINSIFKIAGMAMLNSMGGASGVIFGSMFLGGIKGLDTVTSLNTKIFTLMMSKSLDAIKMRGHAQVGDKTMVDALEPAVIAMQKMKTEDFAQLLEAAAVAAKDGVEKTKGFIAKFGKSQYLGERSLGHQDAGATSVAIIFRAMSDYLQKD